MPRDTILIGDGQRHSDTKLLSVVSDPPRKRGRPRKASACVTPIHPLPSGVSHSVSSQKNVAPSQIVETIRGFHRKHVFYIRAIIAHTNMVTSHVRVYHVGWSADESENDSKKAWARAQKIVDHVERGKSLSEEDQAIGDACAAMILASAEARKPWEAERKKVVRQMESLAKDLPVWEWAEKVRGFGPLGLAIIVGEAGDLGSYSNPGKLWKRFGLAPHNGKVGKTWRMKGGLSAEEWEWLGYNPSRRSEMWNRAKPLLQAQLRKVKDSDGNDTGERQVLGPFGQVYLDRKAYLTERDRDVVEMTPLWIHNRAQQYMEKRLLKQLWQAWHRQPITD